MTNPVRRDPADLLAGVGRHWGWLLAFSIATALAGFLALIWPGKTIVVVAVLFGIQLVLAGAFRFVAAFATPGADSTYRVLTALLGVLSLLFGLYALRHVAVTVAVLALVLGIFWVVHGFVEIFSALADRTVHDRGWKIILGILGVLAGATVLIYPEISLVTLAALLGIWLIVYGIFGIVSAFRLRAAHQAVGRLSPA